MKYLVERLLRRRPAVRQRFEAVAYRSASSVPLHPKQVCRRSFQWTRLGRRGLDPADVQAFLDRVAGDLAAAYDAADRARRETERIKDALRRWQPEQARTRDLTPTTDEPHPHGRALLPDPVAGSR
ncbi:DivIVA domain-containing protein [Micromonospora mangrovi]|uniref:DivIVA domain-containing protein n=1 Tax=Micromonospora mangrovi TaxID=1182597 RepID=A0ABV8MB74_9ACTN